MSVGGKKNEYDFQREEDDLSWWAEQRFNIREVRMISSTLQNYKTVWQGEPDAALRSMDVDTSVAQSDANLVKPKGGEI